MLNIRDFHRFLSHRAKISSRKKTFFKDKHVFAMEYYLPMSHLERDFLKLVWQQLDKVMNPDTLCARFPLSSSIITAISYLSYLIITVLLNKCLQKPFWPLVNVAHAVTDKSTPLRYNLCPVVQTTDFRSSLIALCKLLHLCSSLLQLLTDRTC